MSESLFSAVLTFSLLAAGTLAVGSEMIAPAHTAAAPAKAVATLPAVTVIGRRVAAADAITLPMVTVTGCRESATTVAAETTAEPAPRLQ